MQRQDEVPVVAGNNDPNTPPRYDTMNNNDEIEDEITIPSSTTSSVVVPRRTRWFSPSFYGPCLVIAFWYCLSNGIIFLTKWLFKTRFPYPLTVTTYSNTVSSAWAAAIALGCARGTIPCIPSRYVFWNYVAPIGLCTALEIGCSNVALKILTVSFGTILKGSSPVFTFAFGLLFGLETFSWRVAAALLLIAAGIALASLGEGQEFQVAGFCLSLAATALGGLRWAITHRLLKGSENGSSSSPPGSEGYGNTTIDEGSGSGGGRDENNENDDETDGANDGDASVDAKPLSPLAATLYTSPMTAVCVLPFALALEGSRVFGGGDEGLCETANNNSTGFVVCGDGDGDGGDGKKAAAMIVVLGTMTVIASLVFVLLMSEYWLVKATSSLTLSVAGVFKELLTIGGGIFLFSETIDFLNVVGFLACQVGILAYVFLRTTTTTPGGGENDDAAVAAALYAPVEGQNQREVVDNALPSPFVDEGEDENNESRRPGLV